MNVMNYFAIPGLKFSDELLISRHLAPEYVVQKVCEYFNKSEIAIRGRSRIEAIAIPRHISIYLMRLYCGMTFPKIGRYFRRDHSTAMSSIRCIKDLLDTDVVIKNQIEDIKAML